MDVVKKLFLLYNATMSSSALVEHLVNVVKTSLVVLEAWPWPRGSSRTPHEGLGLGLGLGLDTSGLGLGLGLDTSGLGLERKVLALALARPRPRLFPQDLGHVVAVRVCSAQTHSVT